MPLFVRYHSQERKLEYLSKSNKANITNLSFVGRNIFSIAKQLGQTDKIKQVSLIPNMLRHKPRNSRKNDNFCIGFVGLVPRSKRLDLAIELLVLLLQFDDRYTLKVAGHLPEHYAWLKNRQDEYQYFDSIFAKINSSELQNRIQFVGHLSNIEEFYSSVGHVVSTSDFESFHLTLVDGPVQGAAAHTLNWEGSEEIYSDLWICNSVDEMAQKIHNLNLRNLTAFHAANQLRLYHKEMQPERIALSILQSLKEGVS